MKKLNWKLTGKAKKTVISVSAGAAAAAIAAGLFFGLRGRGEPVGVYPFTMVGMTGTARVTKNRKHSPFGWRCCKKSMAYQNRKNLLVLKKLLLWITPKQAKVQQNSLTAISAQLVF